MLDMRELRAELADQNAAARWLCYQILAHLSLRQRQRVVFLALRGEEGQVECFWPVPLDNADLSSPARWNAGAGLAPPLAAALTRRGG